MQYKNLSNDGYFISEKKCFYFDICKQRISCIELPWIVFFVERVPNTFWGFGLLHPRQLLHRLSGSELQLHKESSSKRSESSKLKWSPSSQSSKGDPTSTGADGRPPFPLLFDAPATLSLLLCDFEEVIRWIYPANTLGVSTMVMYMLPIHKRF